MNSDRVEKLIAAHAAAAVQGYRGNLKFAAQVVQEGWLPAEDDLGVDQYIRALQEYLGTDGQPEADRFLLRLGLVVPGMQRGIRPPLEVLGPDRGGFSRRRLDEAKGQILRLREVLGIARTFFSSLHPDTKQALLQLNDLQFAPPLQDEDLRFLFSQLREDERSNLANRAIGFVDSGKKSVSEIGVALLQNSACLCREPLAQATCQALVERDIYWPSSLYRDAGETVAQAILSRIDEASELLHLNHQLLALAWTRSDAAWQAFRAWSQAAPTWADSLHVAPAVYLQSAGWCLDADGNRRELISTNCVQLIPASAGKPEEVLCRSENGRTCRSCDGPLVDLFDFTSLGRKYFTGVLSEAPEKVVTCLHCSCYAPVFADFEGRTINTGGACKYERYEDGQPSCGGKVAVPAFPPFACAEPFAVADASTIGGIPMWVQDAEFPKCVCCAEIMTFLAQHDNGPSGEEGSYYAFFCAKCRTTAVNYQQT